MLKLAILVSGRGSNLQSIIDQIESGILKGKAQIALVISNNPQAYSLERAKKHGIESLVVDSDKFKDKAQYEAQIILAIKQKNVDLICLAGYMKLLSSEFVKTFKHKIINIHPALLPAFPGLHVQKKALDYGVKFSGCTVHFVDEGCDTGPIIVQTVVPVLANDTEETLSARILEQEHKIYPEAIRRIAEGQVKIVGRRVM
ncbi:MAG: phosphoribosylglycinamide formyltransferase [Candidatus Margulisiibacteriota bacterium]